MYKNAVGALLKVVDYNTKVAGQLLASYIFRGFFLWVLPLISIDEQAHVVCMMDGELE
jgi:hypothetical protein